jgi:hypothetical protein
MTERHYRDLLETFNPIECDTVPCLHIRYPKRRNGADIDIHQWCMSRHAMSMSICKINRDVVRKEARKENQVDDELERSIEG